MCKQKMRATSREADVLHSEQWREVVSLRSGNCVPVQGARDCIEKKRELLGCRIPSADLSAHYPLPKQYQSMMELVCILPGASRKQTHAGPVISVPTVQSRTYQFTSCCAYYGISTWLHLQLTKPQEPWHMLSGFSWLDNLRWGDLF